MITRKTAEVLGTSAASLRGWSLKVMFEKHGGSIMLKRGDIEIIVGNDGCAVYRGAEVICEGTSSIEDALRFARNA